MSLSISPTETPDELDLELLLLGAVPPEQAGPIEAARTGALADVAAEIEAAREVFRRDALPIRPAAAPPRRSGWLVAAGALALAAAVVLVLLLPADPGIRSMGAGLPVDLSIHRSGTAAEQGFRPGDELGLALTPTLNGWVNIGVVQEDGRVFPLVWGESIAAQRGVPLTLDDSVRIDDYAGREWLVVHLSTGPLSAQKWERALRGSLPEPAQRQGKTWYSREITRVR